MKNIILDTDLGCDSDDAGAIALLHNLANNEECNILSISSCTSREDAGYAIQVLNEYYKRDNLPVGINKTSEMLIDKYNFYTKDIIKKYSYKQIELEDSIKLYRKLLSRAEDNSVVIIGIGPLNNLAELLRSEADEYSNLSGKELVKKKANSFYVMMGHFPINNQITYIANKPMHAEWNVLQDIDSTKYFINNCPVDAYICPFDIGKAVTGHKLMQVTKDSPVKFTYAIHSNGMRESWDPVTVYLAIRGIEEEWITSSRGDVFVNDSGVTTFKENEFGKHFVIYQKGENESIIKKIDSLMY